MTTYCMAAGMTLSCWCCTLIVSLSTGGKKRCSGMTERCSGGGQMEGAGSVSACVVCFVE